MTDSPMLGGSLIPQGARDDRTGWQSRPFPGLSAATSDTWRGLGPLGVPGNSYWPGICLSSVWLWSLMAGELGCIWDRSSNPGLREGEMVSGLVSQEPVLCSEVAIVVVVLGGMGSSSSSSRRDASGTSGGRWLSHHDEGLTKPVTLGQQPPPTLPWGMTSSILQKGERRPRQGRGLQSEVRTQVLWITLIWVLGSSLSLALPSTVSPESGPSPALALAPSSINWG